MIDFVRPEAFLLAPLILLWLRRRFWPRPLVGVLRSILLLLLLALLAGPYVDGATSGRDLILLIDRSRSVPERSVERVREIAELAARQRRDGDRIGVVLFGRDAAVETPPTENYAFAPPIKTVDGDATDLARAIDTAIALIAKGRQASILLLSDGEATGADPMPAARAALRRGIRIDAIPLRRQDPSDIAVDEVATPDEVGAGEPFQFSAWVRADQPGTTPFRLLRDGEVIASGERTLRAGLNRLRFRDRLIEPGIHHYEVEVDLPADRIPENNRARAVVRVGGPFRVLCVTPGGRQDRLTRSLQAAGLDVAIAAPAVAPLGLDALDSFSAVILENVAAEDLPHGAMQALAHWVRHLGGGLLMTGGRASYGPGGYHRSPVEEVLPVSMEVRQEQRKFSLAMAIALDRSGSMAMPVSTGETKMDLANLGSCAAVELLTRLDHVAVIAVDSAPHVVVPTTPVEDIGEITARIRSIESMGGGIYTYTALVAAADQLRDAPQLKKHIVLFADAADAEEPGKYETFVPDLVRAGVTVSVIGLGSDTDSDAAFLEDIAKRGQGRCFFVDDPADLPRVFAQETIQVARSSIIEEPTEVAALPDIVAIGDLAQQSLPVVGGYSIAYGKPDAQIGLVTKDEQRAPFLAFWQHGLGRAVAFLGEADGDVSGGLATWPGYGDYFVTVVRWLAGNEADSELFATMTREGHEGVLSVEVEPGREALLGQLQAQVLDPNGVAQTVFLSRVGEHRLEGRIALRGEGVYRAAVQVGEDRHLRVPPVTLPYSPEFERQADPRHGEKTLARLAEITEGRVDPPASELMAGPRESMGSTPLGELCAWLALVFLLLEIAVRRLQLSVPQPSWARLPDLVPARRRRAPGPTPQRATAGDPGPQVPPPTAPAPAAQRDLGSVLDRAKARAKRRRS